MGYLCLCHYERERSNFPPTVIARSEATKQSLFFLKARLPRLTAFGGQARNDKKREIATASLREASQ
jgi:hypothetical protein